MTAPAYNAGESTFTPDDAPPLWTDLGDGRAYRLSGWDRPDFALVAHRDNDGGWCVGVARIDDDLLPVPAPCTACGRDAARMTA